MSKADTPEMRVFLTNALIQQQQLKAKADLMKKDLQFLRVRLLAAEGLLHMRGAYGEFCLAWPVHCPLCFTEHIGVGASTSATSFKVSGAAAHFSDHIGQVGTSVQA